jgi:hypothetical protein
MQRRKFLTASAATATLMAVGKTGNTAGVSPTPATNGFSGARFRSWLNEEFRLTSGSSLRSSRATLVAVEDGPARPGLDQFSVVFRGSASLPTGLCWLSRADGTQFMLHLQGAPAATLRHAHFSLLEVRHG